MSASLKARGLVFAYGGQRVLDGLDLDVEAGEFVAVLGRSGSGKSTLIGTLAGLHLAEQGELRVGDRPVRGPGVERAMVFQQAALLPWLTARSNVLLAAQAAKPRAARAELDACVQAMLETVNLGSAGDKYPPELSGGMRQRVGLARALSTDPQVLLLDEPFSALDALTRATLQDEFERLCVEARKTVVMVTNDLDEALLLADVVLVLREGRIVRRWRIEARRPRRPQLATDRGLRLLAREIAAELAGQDARREVSSRVPQPGETLLDMRQVHKHYDTRRGRQVVVERIDMSVRAGEFVSLLGHSGCGKSTLMSIAVGLVEASSGAVTMAGRPVEGTGLDRALVFQSGGLLPWSRVHASIRLAARQAKPRAPSADIEAVVLRCARLVGLEAVLEQRVSELSAGMRQRVAVARAYALDPRLLLFDEPFAALDSVTRAELQDVMIGVWAQSGCGALLVTHDIAEALYLSDRILLMTDGPNARIAEEIRVPFERPRSRASLEEDPRMAELKQRIVDFLDHHAQQG